MLKSDLEFFRIIYRFFADADRLTWASIAVSVVTGYLYFRLFFPKRDGFNEIPDDYTSRADFKWLELRMMMFILVSVGAGLLAYHQLPDWFPHAFRG
jgi:hypothetical protein